MKTKKVFLSQRMHNRTDNEVLAERDAALSKIQKIFPGYNIEIIDQFHVDNAPEDAGRLFYLGHSIQLMQEADFVYFCRKWELANGCRIERKVCELYGIPFLFDYDF